MSRPADTAVAWLVHCYTALGLVCAAGIAVLIVQGGDASFRFAFVLMIAATVVDASDGWFARKARVKEVLPLFSGRALDDLIDFQTYTSLPLLLVWRAGLLPGGLAWLLLLPLLASAYGFSRVDAKTDDGLFLGFPSYWNVIAFYLYVLGPPPWVSAAIVVGFAVLTFVPTYHLYPSQGGRFSRSMTVGAILWTGAIAWILTQPAESGRPLAMASLIYPLMYLVLSAVVSKDRAKPAAFSGGTP